MPFFSVQDGELKKVSASSWPAEIDIAWLAEQLSLHDDILPEKLLTIGGWGGQNGSNNHDARGLFALDEEGSLAVILLSDRAPDNEWIAEAAELAWDMRYVGYRDLNQRTQEYLQRNGVATEELYEFHRRFFSLDAPLGRGRFNSNQRLIVLAPEFSESAIAQMSWRKFEIAVDAYRLTYIDMDKDSWLISVERLTALQGGAVASFVSLVAGSPAAAVKRLVPGSDTRENQVVATEAPEPTSKAANLFARVDALPTGRIYVALGALIAVYIAIFSFLTVRNHNNFGTFGFDLGIFDQGVWLLSQFKDPFITVRGLHLFGDHLSFILVLFAPLYWIKSDARLLLVMQTAFLAAGAVPVFLLARDRLKSNVLGLALAASYLLYPALEWVNKDQFHPETIATPLLLFAVYFALKSRYLPFAVLSALAVLAKEDIALVVMLLGVYVAATGNRKVGWLVATLSLAWFVISLKFILPHFNDTGFFYINNFSRLGTTPFEVINNSLTKPGMFLSVIAEQNKMVYMMQLFSPVIFLPLMNIELLLVALPPLFTNLVSQQGYMDSIQYHYTAIIIPFVFTSSILAIEKLRFSQKGRMFTAALVVVAALAGNYLLSPSPLSQNFDQGYWDNRGDRRRAIEAALAHVPKNASVSAHYFIVPHLTHREKIYEYPNPFITTNWGIKGENPADKESIQYIVVDLSSIQGEQRLLIDELRNNTFKQIFSKDDIIVLKKN